MRLRVSLPVCGLKTFSNAYKGFSESLGQSKAYGVLLHSLSLRVLSARKRGSLCRKAHKVLRSKRKSDYVHQLCLSLRYFFVRILQQIIEKRSWHTTCPSTLPVYQPSRSKSDT